MKLSSRFYLVVNEFLRKTTGFVLHPDVQFGPRLSHPVDLIIDVGVAEGTPDVYRLAPESPVLLVEPLPKYWPACERILAGKQGQLLKCAAGSREGSAELFEFGLSSSLLPRTDKNITANKVSVSVQPLDILLRDNPYWARSQSCLLKVDTEGYELEALRGATASLTSRKIRYLLVEGRVHGVTTYNFAELVSFIYSFGYEFLDVREVGYGRRQVNYLDCVFQLVED